MAIGSLAHAGAGFPRGAEIWVDLDGTATAADAAQRQSGYRPFDGVAPLPGGKGRVWLRWEQTANDDVPEYISLAAHRQGQIDLYDASSPQPELLGSSGTALPQSEWMVRGRAPVVVLRPADQPRTILFSADGTSRAKLVFQAVPEDEYLHDQRLSYLVFGAYFGLAALALVIITSLAWSGRDVLACIYVGATVALVLAQAALLGFGHEYLWPESPAWNRMSGYVLAAVVVLFWLLGSAALARAQARGAWVQWLLAASIAYAVLSLSTWLWLPTDKAQAACLSAAAGGLLAVTAVLMASWRNGNPYAWGFLMAFAPLLAGSAFPLLREFGLVATPNLHLRYGVQIGSFIEVVLTVLALQARARDLRDRATYAMASSQHDPLTGLMRQSFALQRLERLLMRARKFNHLSGLLMVEVTNLDAIQQEHGRSEAEQALVVAAARLHALAGEFNTAARWQGVRFALLIEGPSSREELTTFATRVVARGLVDSPHLPVGCVLKLRIAICPLDRRIADYAIAVQLANETLDQMRQEQNRTIRWCDPDGAPAPASPPGMPLLTTAQATA